MRLNIDTCLVGKKVVLVPYRHQHVTTYHQWMSNPDLLQLTASEPLALDEEYAMQKRWTDDEDKCTFIILDRRKCLGLPDEIEIIEKNTQLESKKQSGYDLIMPLTSNVQTSVKSNPISSILNDRGFLDRNIHAMVGDINLFLSIIDEDVGTIYNDSLSVPSACRRKQGEFNLMIGELSARRKGIGTEACELMMFYCIQFLQVQRFFVKISEDNLPSLKMFERVLKFKQCSYVKCFQEYELEFWCTATDVMELLRQWKATADLESRCHRPFLFLCPCLLPTSEILF